MNPALNAYADLLRKWNQTINLVSAADLDVLWPRHIEDSLQLGALATPTPSRAIDLGSGAGFPGLILAIAFGIEVDLIEQDQRKAAFLREAAMVTTAPVRVHATKIERANVPPAPLVVSRALAPLPHLFRFAHPFIAEGGYCLFPKSAAVDIELAAAAKRWTMDVARFPSKTDPAGVILRVENLRPKA